MELHLLAFLFHVTYVNIITIEIAVYKYVNCTLHVPTKVMVTVTQSAWVFHGEVAVGQKGMSRK